MMKTLTIRGLSVLLSLLLFPFVQPAAVQAADPKIAIVKLDDLTADNVESFQKIADMATADSALHVSFGLVGKTWDTKASDLDFDRLSYWDSLGIEIWHHGYLHERNYNEDNAETSWTETDGSTFSYQYENFRKTYELVKEKSGITMHSVGAPYNSNDTTFLSMLTKHFPEVRTLLFAKHSEALGEGRLNLSNSLRIESTAGELYSYDQLVSAFKTAGDADYFVMQGHPGSWDEAKLETFRQWIAYLKSQGVIFMTPEEYHNYADGKEAEKRYPEVNIKLINKGVAGPIYDRVELPSTLVGGETVTWSSPDGSIAIDDGIGRVTSYQTNGDLRTFLTARISKDGSVTEKQIPIRICRVLPQAPEDGSCIFYENFDENSIKGSLETPADTDTLDHYGRVEDNRLVLHRGESVPKNTASTMFYCLPSGTYDGDSLAVEFTMYTDYNGGVAVSTTQGSAANRIGEIKVEPDGSVLAYNKSCGAFQKIAENEERTAETPMRITLLHHFSQKSYDVYINGKKAAEGLEFRNSNTTKVLRLYMYTTTNTAENTLYIDAIKIYRQAGQLDSLTNAVINNGSADTTAFGALYLPSVLPDDESKVISWSCESGNVDIEGTCGRIRASRYEDTVAKVTASVVISGITYRKSFCFAVPVCDLPTPELDEYGREILIYSQDFETATMQELTAAGELFHSTTKTDNFTIEDGKLQTSYDSSAKNLNFIIPSHTVTDDLVIEFDMERTTANKMFLQAVPSGSQLPKWAYLRAVFTGSYIKAVQTNENEDGKGTVSTEGTVVKSDYSKIGSSSNIIIKLNQNETNTNSVWSLWVDGEKLVDCQPMRQSTIRLTNIPLLNLRLEGDNTITLDNIRMYKAMIKTEDVVDRAAQQIADEGVSAIVADSDSGAALAFGYSSSEDIAVSFSDEKGLVNADGSITMPYMDTEDTVTVTISKNEYSRSLSFPVTVAGRLYIGSVSYMPAVAEKGENSATVEAYTRDGSSQSIAFALGLYTGDGRMEAVAVQNIVLGEKNLASGNIYTVTVTADSNQKLTRKSFLFDSLTSLRPLTKSDDSLKLPVYFTNGMVLQREQPIAVWGKSLPNTPVTVTFSGQSKECVSDENGEWSVELDSMQADSTGKTLTVQTPQSIRQIQNVLVGDVWLVSGQSNAEYTMSWFSDTAEDIAAANNPQIRYLKMGYTDTTGTKRPKLDAFEAKVAIPWTIPTAETVGAMSALGYYFADKLQPELSIPIGIISAAKGGKAISEFIDSEDYKGATAICYNEMIYPLLPFGIKGLVWYQGEQDWNNTKYEAMFEAMIQNLREHFGSSMPVLYVQLQRYLRNYGGTLKSYEWIRELMRQMDSPEENRHMATIIDLGNAAEPTENHPRGKRIVGERLMRLALHYVYHREEIVPSGPMYADSSVLGNEMNITFRNAGNGLEIRNAQALDGFVLAGADGVFYPAEARITGTNTVTVTSDAVSEPKAVRYLYEAFPEPVTLFNSEGIPASPFTSDNPAFQLNAAE